MSEIACRVCGLQDDWENGYEIGEICSCCGAETGLDDETLEQVIAHRKKWIKGGCVWWSENVPITRYIDNPETWNPIEQMKNIPPEWR